MIDGGLLGLGACYVHGGLFHFDPDTVPAVVIDCHTRQPIRASAPRPDDAIAAPICDDCADRIEKLAGKSLWPRRRAGG